MATVMATPLNFRFMSISIRVALAVSVDLRRIP
jgi:hypothetical protein